MDYVVGAITVLSIGLIAFNRRSGWWVGLVNQGLWIALIVQRDLWGLIAVPIVLFVLHAIALVRS